ncbi:FAD binding domain-containing protein [Planctomonas psychrotolerans]|uniref:FAD binding domain-containing protein n=1 Tax=Planctomonas psychrotolerans TaxID=2528712 RepID=UPI001238CD6B|nr:FAD binding domain-containing protein [Planctomonas psychrotolerans]
MDLIDVQSVRIARTRNDVVLGPGERPMGGGTWLFSEPQPGLTGLVDLAGLDWPAITDTGDTLSVAATCTIATLSRIRPRAEWHAHPLLAECSDALLASSKVWTTATVGGNVCASLPAGAMISLAASLDATALVWAVDGDDYRVPVRDFVTGATTNVLRPGDVLRSIDIPSSALRARTAFRKISLSPLGRSGAVVIGRRDADGAFVLTITAATDRPVQLRFDTTPSAVTLRHALAAIDNWYDDPHGAPDWRRSVSAVLAEEVRGELDVPRT